MQCLISGLRDPRDADIRAAVRLVEPGGQHQPRRPPHGEPARGRRRTPHEPQGEEAEAEAEEEERGQEAEAEAGAEQPRQEEE